MEYHAVIKNKICHLSGNNILYKYENFQFLRVFSYIIHIKTMQR